MVDFPKMATFDEVAAALKKSKKALYHIIQRGRLRKGVYNQSLRLWNLDLIKKCIENGESIYKNNGAFKC